MQTAEAKASAVCIFGSAEQYDAEPVISPGGEITRPGEQESVSITKESRRAAEILPP